MLPFIISPELTLQWHCHEVQEKYHLKRKKKKSKSKTDEMNDHS